MRFDPMALKHTTEKRAEGAARHRLLRTLWQEIFSDQALRPRSLEGFGRPMSDQIDWDAMLRNLHEPWTVGESTHKIHACCGHNFAAIDRVLVLRDAIGGTGRPAYEWKRTAPRSRSPAYGSR